MTHYDRRPATPDYLRLPSALCTECRGRGLVACSPEDPARFRWAPNPVKTCDCCKPVVETRGNV